MRALRPLPGVLALAGFLLPWVHGSGPLAGLHFSGYELVAYAGELQQLEATFNGPLLFAGRLAIVATAVAGTWLVVLGGVNRWRALRWACGAWVGAVASVLLVVNAGDGGALSGTLMLCLAALAFVAMEVTGPISRRLRARSKRGGRPVPASPGAALQQPTERAR